MKSRTLRILPQFEEIEVSEQETASFDADMHLSYMRDRFQFCGMDFNKWTIRFIADNTRTKFKIAHLAEKPHIGCYSHRLNLEVERMTCSMLILIIRYC